MFYELRPYISMIHNYNIIECELALWNTTQRSTSAQCHFQSFDL